MLRFDLIANIMGQYTYEHEANKIIFLYYLIILSDCIASNYKWISSLFLK